MRNVAHNMLAAAHDELGQFDVALAIHEKALRLAEAIGHSSTLLHERLESCGTLVRRAAFHDAIPRLEVAIKALRDAGLHIWVVSGSAMLGYSLAMTGRLSRGSRSFAPPSSRLPWAVGPMKRIGWPTSARRSSGAAK